MDGKKEAANFINVCSEAAESYETIRKNTEKSIEVAQRNKEEAIAEIYKMMGKISSTTFFKAQAEFFSLVMLKQVKELKQYRELLGMTWDEFCRQAGVARRTIDRYLDDLEPFNHEFLGQLANFSGVTFNKIKYLGLAVKEKTVILAENSIIYNGENIPFDNEHKDEFEALLTGLEENYKKQSEEAKAVIRTKDRLLEAKDDVIKKMDREINRLQKITPKSALTPEEQDAINPLIQAQLDIATILHDIKRKILEPGTPDIAVNSYYHLLILVSKTASEDRISLQEKYEKADHVPWEITEFELPPTDVFIDGLPSFAGREIGKKVIEHQEEIAAKRNKKVA